MHRPQLGGPNAVDGGGRRREGLDLRVVILTRTARSGALIVSGTGYDDTAPRLDLRVVQRVQVDDLHEPGLCTDEGALSFVIPFIVSIWNSPYKL